MSFCSRGSFRSFVLQADQKNYIASSALGPRHGCQMAIVRFLDCLCMALRASGLWLRYAALLNLIPSFPWIAPPPPPPWRNPRKGRDQILPSGNFGRRRRRRQMGQGRIAVHSTRAEITTSTKRWTSEDGRWNTELLATKLNVELNRENPELQSFQSFIATPFQKCGN